MREVGFFGIEVRRGFRCEIKLRVNGQWKKDGEDHQKERETDFAKKVIRVSGFKDMFGKETSPGIAFIDCPEGYFFFQV